MSTQIAIWIALVIVFVLASLFVLAVGITWGSQWARAYFADADVSLRSLIAMSLLGLDSDAIVSSKIVGRQAGLRIDHGAGGMTTERLQAHAMAGGDVLRVVQALVVARGAGLEFEFDTAAAVDLAGRDVLAAIQGCVLPRVIRCPIAIGNTNATISAVAKNGVELRVSACVTVRTNMKTLIGGATEETIIARIGESIVANIGSAQTHTEILALPSRISTGVRASELSRDTIFEIVSIDIASVSVGKNIGARLTIDQAEADMQTALADAEGRRSQAIATLQQMKARVVEYRAILVRMEACVPRALAQAYRTGIIGCEADAMRDSGYPKIWAEESGSSHGQQRTIA
ncbi:MAG: flotillin-like FloA family protein [Pirellula sp.]